ncbi:ubiquitin carboxyl-terminal hydrolase CYLD [Pseudoliparis swirei]|uniref:ubiquitin carboxyl-terminal hydrolase CYLD n=1 Tax=Pseudoliparis swirei TaxID=2059687 RepID=UPI0024BDAEBD|nr:ubiquitin carboxyl-terminal hydrolase CYLD [Pseudoliparis swirei]
MSAAHDQVKKRRPPKVFLISTDLKVQDELDGTILLQRGWICHEQDSGRNRGDSSWVKVLDNSSMLKIERKFLLEVPTELNGLLEPVSDPEARLKLLCNPAKLQLLASLPADAPLWVQVGSQDELAEADLKYVGPLTRGGGVLFGVQLKGSAVGKGTGNGSYKGQRLFGCPDGCSLFVPVSHVRLRSWAHEPTREPTRERDRHRHHLRSRSNDAAADRPSPPQQQHHSRHAGLHPRRSASPPPAPGVLSRAAESAPLAAQNQVQVRGPAASSPPRLHVGQRVCFASDGGGVHGGEVCFCGPLPGRSSSGSYVGVLLDAPVGHWDGLYKGEKLCHIPNPLYGLLLPGNKVSAESRSHRHPPSPRVGRPVLKPAPPPLAKPGATSPSTSAPKVALMPPSKLSLKPPPLPLPLSPLLPPKPTHGGPPPPPPPKPGRSPAAPASPAGERLQHNGAHRPPSPMRSPDGSEDAREDEEEDEEEEEEEEAGPEGELEVGSMVEVNDPPLVGVIRWIGLIAGVTEPVAGIELDQELSAGTDGSFLGERHFRCPGNKGLFVKLRNCRRDSRFPAPETPVNQVERCNSIAFAEWGSERVEEHTPPSDGAEAAELYHGWKRGIQGHLNSCYLDATLFSLFSCCSSVDWVLFWPSDSETEQDSSEAQDLLRCEIVNPLRRNGYVCASKTMALRRLLEAANSDMGFTNQEKDPEEFLIKLFQLLRVEPLLKIRSMTQRPQEGHLYQLFPPTPALPPSPPPSPVGSPAPITSPSPGRMRVASVQALLESSFLHAGLKFVEAPSCLLLLMPRFGKDFKMFDAISPTLSLDITDLLDDTLRQCSICQAVADWECLQCYEDPDITPGQVKQYCQTCNTQVHSHRKRASHAPVSIAVPGGPWAGPLHCARQRMSLFAVTCIETSHYVSFVKHGPRPDDWLFFDSMADREGGENGFNVPRVKACPEVGSFLGLSEDELARVDPASLQESARRLLCDSYMCLYHSPELSLYK